MRTTAFKQHDGFSAVSAGRSLTYPVAQLIWSYANGIKPYLVIMHETKS